MGGLAEVLSGLRAYRVAVSDSAAREVRRYYGLRVHQVIENSVPIPEGVHENPPKEGFLYVGRRESRKGYELAVEVASGLGEQLRVAGPGTDPRTCDLGVLDYQALSQEYRRAAALIFPTKYEACSYVVLEARPWLSSRHRSRRLDPHTSGVAARIRRADTRSPRLRVLHCGR